MIIYESQVVYTRKEIPSVKICNPEDSSNFFRKFYDENITDPTKEHVAIAVLNSNNYVIDGKILTIGCSNSCILKASDVIKHVLLKNGNAFILCHNHPSGQVDPSSQDLKVTRAMREAANVMDLYFFDHIILGEKENDVNGLGYYSFRSAGII